MTRSRSAAIKLALMDSHLVVGVGNIYANESLFRAGIRPTTRASKVSRPRLARLVTEVRDVLTEAIAKGGSTLRDYVDAEGEPGYFQLDYFVYGREGEPCRKCGTPIRHRRLGARASFYCPALPALTGPGRHGATRLGGRRSARTPARIDALRAADEAIVRSVGPAAAVTVRRQGVQFGMTCA